MKRVRCPKCDNYVVFDDSKYTEGQSLIFECAECGKQFGIRMGVSKLKKLQRDDTPEENLEEAKAGAIVVIENVFHYKQIIPLRMGENIVGKYSKGGRANCAIETVDPSVDLTHCAITVSHDKRGALKYTLRDGPSYTGTFVDNELLEPKEQREITDGTLFTIGATSIILRTATGESK